MLTVRFWGVRGSLPCPGPDTIIFGGNTTCLEIRADGRPIIIDLGTGIRPLGDWLISHDYKNTGKIEADVFVTHTHWDHVMGFPMFKPIYAPCTKLRITAPASFEKYNLQAVMEKLLAPPLWPVRVDELAAHIEYSEIGEETVDLGSGLTVTGKLLNHPNYCMGYRFSYQGKSITTIFDHEPFNDKKENEKLKQFVKGSGIVIYDAQYKEEEYSDHVGWGHSSYDQATLLTRGMDVKKLIFFHHDPSRTDNELEEIEKKHANKTNPEIIIAKEGLILEA